MGSGAADVGRRAARCLKALGERPDVRTLAASMGIAIVERASPPPAQPGLRSEYRPSPPRIILYRKAIAYLADKVASSSHRMMLGCDLEEVHIAHELFHHLESEQGLGRLGREETEKAAHAFAQEMLDLPFDPVEVSAVALSRGA